MKKPLVWTAIAGLFVSVVGVGLQYQHPAFGTVLDGFSINTQDKSVTVTLFTDQRTQYTTETQGRQYSIILPNTQLSPEQVNNGLPVVIDNKNRFIGRAVPTDDGQVKIILPNLPADDYAISIQQKRTAEKPVQAVAKASTAIQSASDNQFEQAVSDFKQSVAERPAVSRPTANRASTKVYTSHGTNSGFTRLKLSPPPMKAANGSIWNPYVVQPKQETADNRPQQLVSSPSSAPHHIPPPIVDEPITTVSVADSANGLNPAGNGMRPNNSGDPLWYLHALPPSNPAQDTLHGLAKTLPAVSAAGLQAPPAPQKPVEVATKPVSHQLAQEMKEMLKAVPKWLLVTMAIFLGGMGLFTLVGGLVLLRILFSQAKQSAFTGMPQQPLVFASDFAAQAGVSPTSAGDAEKSAYAAKPEPVQNLRFSDTASINALDYLKASGGTVPQAVHNTVLLKFPNRSKGAAAVRARRPAGRLS